MLGVRENTPSALVNETGAFTQACSLPCAPPTPTLPRNCLPHPAAGPHTCAPQSPAPSAQTRSFWQDQNHISSTVYGVNLTLLSHFPLCDPLTSSSLSSPLHFRTLIGCHAERVLLRAVDSPGGVSGKCFLLPGFLVCRAALRSSESS